MNLLVKKFVPLAVVLLTVLLVISCEDPGRIGLILNKDNGVISTHYYETVLPTSVVQFDPRKTMGSYSVQAGEYYNDDFGRVTSKTYSWLSLQPEVTLEDDAQFVSFEMEIGFTDAQGEAMLTDYKHVIDIYKLAAPIDPAAEYTRLDEIMLESSPLGTWEFEPIDNDTLQTDSTYIITLDRFVGRDIFDLLKNESPVLDTDTTFNNYFYGVAFVPTTVNSNVIFIDRDRVIFRVNYNEFNSDGTAVNREYEMHLSSIGFNNITSDLTGTALSGLAPDNSKYYPSDDYRYMQFGTMIAIQGDLTPVLPLFDTLENMIINKAEITIGGLNEYSEQLEPPGFIQTYFTDENNTWPIVDEIGRIDTAIAGQNFIMLQNEEQITEPGYYRFPQSTSYDTLSNRYRVNMTFFMQNFYKGKFYSESEPFLEEKLRVYFFGESSTFVPERTSSHIFTTPMAMPKDSIRLKIYYTIPTKKE